MTGYKRRRIWRLPQASKRGVSDESPKLANNNGSNDQLVALYRLVLLVPRESTKKWKIKKAFHPFQTGPPAEPPLGVL